MRRGGPVVSETLNRSHAVNAMKHVLKDYDGP